MVHVAPPTIRDEGDTVVVEAKVTTDSAVRTLWFRLAKEHQPSPAAIGNALFAALLPVAMAHGNTFRIDAPVSPTLVRNGETIQDILTTWHPTVLSRVAVVTLGDDDATSAHPTRSGTLCCFTGGVDSYYSLAKNSTSITSLLFVHGFDIPIADEVFRRETAERLRGVAADYSKQLVEVETNLRQLTNQKVNWGSIAHGPALAGVGLLLGDNHGRLIMPSSHTYNYMRPRGSHPALDYLWATDRFATIHDGAEATRIEKTELLSTERSAQHHLRVCWKNQGAYNCGVCEKCVRTMTTLELLGQYQHFEGFPQPFDVRRISELVLTADIQESFQMGNLKLARSIDRDGAIARAIRDVVLTYRTSRDAPSVEADPVSSVDDLARELASLTSQVGALAAAADDGDTALMRRIEAIESTALPRIENRVAKVETESRKLAASLPMRAWRKISRLLHGSKRR